MISNISKKIIKGIVYSQFHEKIGPIPKFYDPEDLLNEIQIRVSFKSINTMVGTRDSYKNSFSCLPFQELGLKGLVRTFSIRDNTKRGKESASAVSLIFNEEDDTIFYKYMNIFKPLMIELADKISKLEEKNADKNEIKSCIRSYYLRVLEIIDDLYLEESKTNQNKEFPILHEKKVQKKEFKFKILVLGDPGVGKTSIILKFTDNAFRKTYIPTLGVNISEKNIDYPDKLVRLIIWDIAGQNKFEIMRKHYYESGNGLLLVFDLTRLDSFKNTLKWYDDLKRFIEKDIIGIIIGNKNDLEEFKIVKPERINKLKKKLDMEYFNTSALTGENILEVFNHLAELLLNKFENK
ncbi:MAG: Rab family GTPase [Candidatus Helarchaeota archaeon]